MLSHNNEELRGIYDDLTQAQGSLEAFTLLMSLANESSISCLGALPRTIEREFETVNQRLLKLIEGGAK